MSHRIKLTLAFTLCTGALAVSGCEPEGVGTIGPPKGAARKDDSFLIPGYDPEAAKALKKKSKAAQSKPKVDPVDLKSQRH